jgi:signal peptidase
VAPTPFATAADVVARSLLATAALLVLAATAPLALGWRGDVVMTGSMRPVITPGDVVVSRAAVAADVRVGEVVLVVNPARPATTLVHRVVRINADGSLVTQGDANPGPDSTPVPPDLVRARPRLRIPYVGLPVLWARTGSYGRVALVAATAGLLFACLRRPDPPRAAELRRSRGRGRGRGRGHPPARRFGGRHRTFAATRAREPARRTRDPARRAGKPARRAGEPARRTREPGRRPR